LSVLEDNPNIDIPLIDNRVQKGEIPTVITLAELNKIDYSNLIKRYYDKLKAGTERLYREGKIKKAIRDGLLAE